MAAAETHLVTPGGALGDDAAPPDVRLVPGDAEEEEYEEPTRPCARAPARESGASPRRLYWAWRASRRRPSAFWGGGGSRSRTRRPNYGNGAKN